MGSGGKKERPHTPAGEAPQGGTSGEVPRSPSGTASSGSSETPAPTGTQVEKVRLTDVIDSFGRYAGKEVQFTAYVHDAGVAEGVGQLIVARRWRPGGNTDAADHARFTLPEGFFETHQRMLLGMIDKPDRITLVVRLGSKQPAMGEYRKPWGEVISATR